MANYNNFSPFYDLFTCDVDYSARAKYIMKIFEVDKTKSDFSFVEFNNVPLTTNKLRYKKNYNNALEVVPETDTNWQVFTCCKKVVSNKDFPIMQVITAILSHGLNSVLYQELREKRGLIYGILKGFLTIYLILAVFSVISPLITNWGITSAIQDSSFGSKMYNNNIILNLIIN